ncbi:MAG: glycosyltransferase [Candidatus Limnocylindria bacterium]
MSGASGGEPGLRALHVISNLEVGGAQEVVRSLLPALRRAGASAAVATLRDGPLRQPLETAGIPVTVIPGRSRSLAGDPRALTELRRLYRDLARVVDEHRSEVVQTHLMRSLDFLALALHRRPSRPSVIWTFHNARLDLRADQLPGRRWLLRPKRAGYRSLYRRASRAAGALVAVSEDVARSVDAELRPAAGRLVTIPNGVEIERYAVEVDRTVRREIGVPDASPLFICVAKMLEQKGHRYLVDALAAVDGHGGRPMHVALLGDGPLRDQIEAGARAAGVADRLHFLGTRSDVPRLLMAADAFVLPSLWEGLPMALLEAMAAGLPVIATSVSGTRQVVEDGRTGMLVAPEDSAALAIAMGRLAAEPELRARLGAAGRDHVRAEFSVDVQAQRHMDLYRACLRRERPGAVA